MNESKTHLHPPVLLCLALAAAVLAVFWQVQGHEFIRYDDYEYVVENPHVRNGLTLQNVVWAFSTPYASNWHPLTFLSHMLDCELYGLNPAGHHLNSLLIHLLNTLLLFLILARATGALWRSAFVAALFGLHPLHVESVAWVAERKDVLSTFFWILTVHFYIRYTEGPGAVPYMISLLFFSLGLMSKPMLVTLPFVLLLMDYWPLERFRFKEPGEERGLSNGSEEKDAKIHVGPIRLLLEKTPFLMLAASSSVVTFLVQEKWGAVHSLIPLKTRIANALFSYVHYLIKALWPGDLAFFYPHPGNTLPMIQVLGAGILLAGLTLLALCNFRRIPYLIVGWFWYLGTLFPVIGLIQAGPQAMADRYTYMPLIGVFLIVTWGAYGIAERHIRLRPILLLSAAVCLSALSVSSWFQVRHWKDSRSLFEHALAVTASNFLAHNNLGNVLAREGRTEEAVRHFSEAIRIQPGNAAAHNNFGNALLDMGKHREALFHYREALRLRPDFREARLNLQRALERHPQQAGPSKTAGGDPDHERELP